MVPDEHIFTQADVLSNGNWKVHRCEPTQGSLPQPSRYHCLLRTSDDDGCCLVLQGSPAEDHCARTESAEDAATPTLSQEFHRNTVSTVLPKLISVKTPSIARHALGPFQEGALTSVHSLSLPHGHTLPIFEIIAPRKALF